MSDINQITKQDVNHIKKIYKEIGIILIECKNNINEALFDKIRKRAIIQTLINLKEKIDLLGKTTNNEKLLSIFDKKFRKTLTITRNIAAHRSEALNLDIVERLIKYDLKKIRLKINNFMDNAKIVENKEIATNIKKSYKNNSNILTKFVVWVVLFPICALFMFVFALIVRNFKDSSYSVYDDNLLSNNSFYKNNLTNKSFEDNNINNDITLAISGIEPYSTIYGFNND